ncbi:ribosome biogenesis protein Nop16 [Chytridium lagenaria]|nr:ribosome biogenesis protein Nop16 [Chytridium lagenaria]
MVRPAARRKTKNPHLKVRRRTKNPYNISFTNVPLPIQQAWDKKLTLRQNYEKLGLVSNLNGRPVDFEKMGEVTTTLEDMDSNEEGIFTKDEETYGIDGALHLPPKSIYIGTVSPTIMPTLKPKIYPVTSTKRSIGPITSVVDELKKKAAEEAPVDRHVSDQEVLVFQKLVEKWGSDVEGMARDRKLNVYQLTAGQIKRKLGRSVKP